MVASCDLTQRVLMAFPAGTYCLPALLRLLRIEPSRSVPTACVECLSQPRMLINPDFVERHANTPERLMMLVMHELHHVILGHTRLYERITPLDNIVLDAVINATLCRLFPDDACTELFRSLYQTDQFPHCMLRPPVGWNPDNGEWSLPEALDDPGRPLAAAAYRSLYGPAGAGYAEIREAIRAALAESDPDTTPLVLLGDHRDQGTGESSSSGGLESRCPVLLDEIRRVVKRWPTPPLPNIARSWGDALKRTRVKPRRSSRRSQLQRLLRRIGGGGRSGGVPRSDLVRWTVQTAVPSSDRRAMVQRRLGHRPLLHQAELARVQPLRSGDRVHVYLDVSGSVDPIIPALYGAIISCSEFIHDRVHLFSTEVSSVTVGELRRGVRVTSRGTCISCVARHIARNRIRRAVIVTDGYVGRVNDADRDALRLVRLGVALVGPAVSRDDLAPIGSRLVTFQEITL